MIRAAGVLLLTAALSAQVAFEQAIQDLASRDAGTRLKAVQALKSAPYLEAAVPLAAAVTDSQDQIQLDAIAAELNIFLAERVVPKKRVGLVVEVRNAIDAEATFTAGPLAVGPQPVPPAVLTALRAASRDDAPRVAIEALYALGTLGVVPRGPARRELLRASGPELAALVGAREPELRFAALRVLGRLFERRPGDDADDAIEETVGDALIAAVNDKDRHVNAAALQALGAMRYDRAVQSLSDLFAYYQRGTQAEAALDALARIANRASVPLFAAQLTSRSSAIRGIAIEGLARSGERARWPEIEAALKAERDDGVQLAGAFAAAMLGGASIERVGEFLKRGRLHDQARQYLMELAPGRVSAFAALLKDGDPRVRADAVDALALAGDAAALPLVEPFVSDPDVSVAVAAQRAVARLSRSQ